MTDTLKLMAVLAHPDDESLGTGGILAKYAAEGIETSLVTATRGERGWFGDEREYPGLEALGQIREAELRAAAEVLGDENLRLRMAGHAQRLAVQEDADYTAQRFRGIYQSVASPRSASKSAPDADARS